MTDTFPTHETVTALLVQELLADPVIAEHVGERFYAPGSQNLGPNVSVPKRPYMAWKELATEGYAAVRDTSRPKLKAFQIFVYDEKGDFTRINQILDRIEVIISEMAPFTLPDGTRCSESRWVRNSGTFGDDGYDSCSRFSVVHFTVSK